MQFILGLHRFFVARKLTVIFAVSLMQLFFVSFPVHAGINFYEKELIRHKIEAAFQLLIQSWQEELYFEMYDFGQKESKNKLSKEEFAQRMVELKWKPGVGKANVVIKEIKLLYRNYGLVIVEIEYQHKTNTARVYRKQEIFPAILENNNWKFDLTQIIRIPY